MGILSDRIGAQLAEMRARHAQTDREIAVLKREAQAAFERWKQAADALDAELADWPRGLTAPFLLPLDMRRRMVYC